MDVVVIGASGRMGRTLISSIAASRGALRLIGAVESEGSPNIGRDAGEIAGIGTIGVAITTDALPLVVHAHGIFDFTTPATSVAVAALAAQARIVHVLGTTGLSLEDEARITAAARHAVIIRSGNFSLGVNVLTAVTRKVAQALPASFDIEIVEMHHRMKVDAPSGTALMLGAAAAEGRGVDLAAARIPARDGHTGQRPEGGIGFAALRGGSVIGEHSVVFAGQGERLELTHRAEDRSLFSQGALVAALWGRGKKPGLYSMVDVLGLADL